MSACSLGGIVVQTRNSRVWNLWGNPWKHATGSTAPLTDNVWKLLEQTDEKIKMPFLDFHLLISLFLLYSFRRREWRMRRHFPFTVHNVSQLSLEEGNAQTCRVAARFPEASGVHRNCKQGYCKFKLVLDRMFTESPQYKIKRGKFPKNINQRIPEAGFSCYLTNSWEIPSMLEE